MAYNTITLDENELLQNEAVLYTPLIDSLGLFNGEERPLQFWIGSILLQCYDNGIINGELNTATGDLKFGTSIIKNWSNGDVLQIGDIVRLDNNSGNSAIVDESGHAVYFKVTGRKFRYAGCAFVDIEFMQIK